MPSWPVSLPQTVGWDDYSESTPSGATLRSLPDTGPVKTRPRVSKVTHLFTVALPRLSSDQVDTLQSFYENDCAMGSAAFTWVHPRSQADAVITFMSEIKIVGVARNRFKASFDMAIQP